MSASKRAAVGLLAALAVALGLIAAMAQTPPTQAPPAQQAPANPQAPQATAPPGPQEAGATPPSDEAAPDAAAEATRTPGGALALFMSSRDYHTIRELKSVMTPALRAAYDHDSAPFNGRKGTRLAAFDFRDPVVRPQSTSCTVLAKSLWEDQGEAVEQRAENVRLTRGTDGGWQVAALEKGTVEPLRFKDAIPGVTSLRQLLRAWQKRDLTTAKTLMSDAYLRRFAGREEGLAAVFAGDPAQRRAAFRILDMTPRGTTEAVARIRLVETAAGKPSSLEGTPKSLTMVKRGQRWLLNDWK
jgi:hypothetical protein